jgi:hypothetical protein
MPLYHYLMQLQRTNYLLTWNVSHVTNSPKGVWCEVVQDEPLIKIFRQGDKVSSGMYNIRIQFMHLTWRRLSAVVTKLVLQGIGLL